MNKAVPFVSQDTFVPQTSSSTVNAGPQKKKRTKVTDTRLSPRVARALLQDGFYHRSRPSIDLINRKRRPQFPLSAADLSVLLDYCANYYAAPALSEWGIKHCFCPSVRPSVAYIANNSRTRRPSMPKFGIKAPHLWCYWHTSLKVKRSKVKVTRPNADTHRAPCLPNGKAYELQTWYTDGGRRPASATGVMTSKVKGQGRKVTWSVWAIFAQCPSCIIRVRRGHTVSANMTGGHTSCLFCD